RLISFAVAGGGAGVVEYSDDGSVAELPATANLSGAVHFQTELQNDTLAAHAVDRYIFSIRQSEIDATTSRMLTVRVAVTGSNGLLPAVPEITGLQALSVERSGNTIVALYAVEQEGQYFVTVTGEGDSSGNFDLSLTIAGDLNTDGLVDGQDSEGFATGAFNNDINGDGSVNATDRQLLFANYGFVHNLGPQVQTPLPEVLTHIDLTTTIDLANIAADPDGDAVFYRIVSSQFGTATLGPDGRSVRFVPDSGFSGTARFEVIADDGFNASAAAIVEVVVSDAPLTDIRFSQRELLLDVGENLDVDIFGDFADQRDVPLPLEYVQARILDTTVVTIDANGLIQALQEGDTALVASRGNITAATSIGVGIPEDTRGQIAFSFGISAYPDSVTIPPSGSRQIVVGLGTLNEIFVSNAADGTTYYVSDESIVRVTPDGLIEAVAEGSTTVTVIHRGREDQVLVQVKPPLDASAGPVEVGSAGASVEGPGGQLISFGPGQLQDGAMVKITTVAETDLPLPTPPSMTFAGAYELELTGSEINGAMQVAVPVDDSFQAGDEVFFFQKIQFPNELGELIDYWAVVDSGKVGDDGMARSTSPPFPGLSQRGNVLIAKAAQPLRIIRIEMDWVFNPTMLFLPALGFGGLMLWTAQVIVPVGLQAMELQVWRQWGDMAVPELQVIDVGADTSRIRARVPEAPAGVAGDPPVLTDLQYSPGTGGGTLRIEGEKFLLGGSPDNVQVVFTLGNKRIVVPGDEATGVSETMLEVSVPSSVLIGMADITVERSHSTPVNSPNNNGSVASNWLSSQPGRITNPGGYGFIMSGSGGDANYGLKVIDIQNINETEPEQVVKVIPVSDTPWRSQTVPTADRSRVYLTGNQGVYVVDAVSLQLHDVNPDTSDIDVITIPGGAISLALDPNERYLYVASGDNIYIVDIRGGSDTFHTIVGTISNVGTAFSLISHMAVNADGTKLFASAPATTFYGGVQSYTSGGRERGKIIVINVDDRDRTQDGMPGGPRRWRQVIGELDGGVEPRDIKATTDPNKMVFASYLSNWRGFGTISVTNSNPGGFAATVNFVPLRIMPQGQFFIQKYELDVQNVSAVVVTPDLAYGFAIDWYHAFIFPRDLDQLIRDNLRERGAKVGIIKDPFGLNGEPKLLGVTSPIPLGFGEELRMSSDGRKLYANYRGTGDVLVFDVKKFIDEAETLSNQTSGQYPLLSRQPIDRVVDTINLPGIAVGGLQRGLSLQVNDPLELISPQGLYGGVGSAINFEWEVDTELIGDADYEVRLYVSTQQEGYGIWPDDPARRRNEPELTGIPGIYDGDEYDTDPTWTEDDGNPHRIYASDWTSSSSASGSADGRDQFVEMVAADISKLLTAGNRYYWGVELKVGDATFRKTTNFVAQPVSEQTITVLTHGFQLGVSVGDSPYQQPAAFMEMADLIRDAAGDGYVLSYNKSTGQWVDRENGTDPVAAINSGKSVVLVSDWNKESDISDSGFSEAAADAMFASLADLNRRSGSALFGANLHFIGHSRGTVVNSEIIQRIGRWYPDVNGIHMTTLDPHDFKQDSLDVPVGDTVNWFKTVFEVGSAVSAVVAVAFPPSAPVLVPVSEQLLAAANALEKALNLADALGIAIDPIPFADFQDPDVKVWENVGFADNYYQEQGLTGNDDFTATPNGISIPAADLNVSLDGRAGFTQDDFEDLFLGSLIGGVGGPHSRVWQWYAGTINVGLQ
ncbi:MAG: Ig-like domain-containing protein, partial [Planctomycetales bacterium]|nr:Ig-like domain-containing protein [Planctomycetales bacterium]